MNARDARAERMSDGEYWICPLWCTQPDDEDGEHVGEWHTYHQTMGPPVDLSVRASASWHRQGVGGPGRIEMATAYPSMSRATSPAGTVETTPDEWESHGDDDSELIEMVGPGGPFTVTQTTWRVVYDLLVSAEQVIDVWHVYNYPIGDAGHYLEAYPGAYDDYIASGDEDDEECA